MTNRDDGPPPKPAVTLQRAYTFNPRQAAARLGIDLGPAEWVVLEVDNGDLDVLVRRPADNPCAPLAEPVKPCGCLSFGEDCDACRTDPVTPADLP